MSLDQLVHLAKNSSRFDSHKRIPFPLLVKLLAKCSHDLHSNWNCLIVPQQEICEMIRLHSDLRNDCQGQFTALLITQQLADRKIRPYRFSQVGKMELATWLLRLIYTAQGMDLLIKPLFHINRSVMQSALQLRPTEEIRLVLLIGYPEHPDTLPYVSPQIRFFTRHQ